MRKRRRLITQRSTFYRMTFTSLSKKFISAIQSQQSAPHPVIEVKGQAGWRRRLCMTIELQINNSTSHDARVLGWGPSPCRIRLTNPSGTAGPSVDLQMTGKTASGGGRVVFRAGATGVFLETITVTVPTSGGTVPFFASGKFGQASSNNGDVAIEVRAGATVIASVPVMVRIRKNANQLTTAERDRFVGAFAKLNNQGQGRFKDFRDMHVLVSLSQAHGAA